MSSEALLNEVRLLRRDLADLSSRVLALEDLAARQSEELAARSPSAVTSYTAVTSVRTGSPGLPSPAASAAGFAPAAKRAAAANFTDAERRAVAVEVGQFLSRALAGEHRGPSGRSKLPLASRIYVLARDINLVTYDPVQVHRSFASLRPFVKDRNEECGDSVFAGFPSAWEAKVAVEAAGLRWPADY